MVGNHRNVADFLAVEAASPTIGAIVMSATYSMLPRAAKSKTIFAGPEVWHYAQNLYANLRAFDNLRVDKIFAECTPFEGIGLAVMDRMQKAAEGRIIIV